MVVLLDSPPLPHWHSRACYSATVSASLPPPPTTHLLLKSTLLFLSHKVYDMLLLENHMAMEG